ncbi:hypothetical protein DENSPDRAFT_782506 [Dentipellis sp. KUC8613]|nr:hypothetical protein DENSPDRAFT_782506 [Dentipellis sp. KUC8613]
MPAPAHRTKHLPLISHPPFLLTQHDDHLDTGTTLWLGAQCLASYLPTLSRPATRPTALELGSGIGLTALILASLGWHVLATDTRHVITTVLGPNVSRNASQLPPASGEIHVRELDWSVLPEHWDWTSPTAIACSDRPPSETPADGLSPPFDLIVSSDTLYHPELITPLLRTMHAVCTQSLAHGSRPPPVYLCIERRDPALIDQALLEAKTRWNFRTERVPQRKLSKAMEKGGLRWAKEDWEGVELWKLTLRRET